MMPWIDRRPAGEWLVELYRSPIQFGWNLNLGIQGPDDKLWVVRAHEGKWEFMEYEPNTEAPPALFLDNELGPKLANLFRETPLPLEHSLPLERVRPHEQRNPESVDNTVHIYLHLVGGGSHTP